MTKQKKFNLYRKFNLYKTQNQKKLPEPKIVRIDDYNCAYLTIMAVLIIFPVILQTKGKGKVKATVLLSF